MAPETAIPNLLMAAWLLPLLSFALISIGYTIPQYLGIRVPYANQKFGAYIAIAAIVCGFLLSSTAMFRHWLPAHPLPAAVHHDEHGEGGEHDAEVGHDEHAAHAEHEHIKQPYITGDWYTLGEWGNLKLTIGYYIDTLTMTMFCMVTLIASCVHIYAFGYMHDELHDYTDHDVTLDDGHHLHRRGRFHRFFQYLSLFSFSMLGICISGNLAMTFVFWELVGICSYFLIGFYIERQSASTAANKAFIVNRVGDFGMLIGLMAIWSTIGTFNFGDMKDAEGNVTPGIFSHVRTEANDFKLAPPDSMIAFEAQDQVAAAVNAAPTDPAAAIASVTNRLRGETTHPWGHWLLFVAGVGVFCGCVGKSAQFPLHTWLPDAMEGPTPVSALVHSATMVAAGVFLVGRVYPLFLPEALLVIASVGCITLFIAAVIAVTAVDIKRVLAYSTISQLGFMMLALGLGGWLAGLFHLITHAFFKSLLFLCSGSVIHAVHSNDMRVMGGLRKKMPITAYTMLIGCLAIAGIGVPFLAGFSGFHSKDLIVEQALSHWKTNSATTAFSWAFFWIPLFTAGLTAFYMFRLWFMTFAGEPRDHHKYDHAHESQQVMTGPLVLLAVFAVCAGWHFPSWAPGSLANFGVENLLEQARPVGTLGTTSGLLFPDLTIPSEHLSHAPEIKWPAGWAAILAALSGIALAAVVYLKQAVSAEGLAKTLWPLYQLSWNKWWFDELYDFVFVRPTLAIGAFIAVVMDKGLIDGIIHTLAAIGKGMAAVVFVVGDRFFIDKSVDTVAARTWDLGLALRSVQTGRLRQYVMFIVVGTIVIFLVASVWRYAVAG
jgi:proton-translocating NADH-quinone oxidoreductase chain L